MAAVVSSSAHSGRGLLPSALRSVGSSRELCNVPSRRRRRNAACRAVLQDDAPYAIAIGVCMFSTLVLSNGDGKSEDAKSVLGPDDVRYAAMGIISFIPLFDWLAWVFAWLDTSRRRYLIYSIVYLAPYFKNGLSLSTDDSWLPLASVVACVIHVQLEIAVNNEGLEQAQIKQSITRMLYEKTRVKELQERSTGLLSRLQHLAERTADPPSRAQHDEGSSTSSTAAKSEFEEWDEKLSKKNTGEKKTRRDSQRCDPHQRTLRLWWCYPFIIVYQL